MPIGPELNQSTQEGINKVSIKLQISQCCIPTGVFKSILAFPCVTPLEICELSLCLLLESGMASWETWFNIF